VNEESATLEVNGAVLDGNGALSEAAGPEGMPHGTPRVAEVGSEEGFARLAGLEALGSAGDLDIDDSAFIVHALDGIKGAVLGQLDRAVLGIEARLVVAKLDILEGSRTPEVGLRQVVAEDLAVELASGSDATI
jgi:hypothetical protein